MEGRQRGEEGVGRKGWWNREDEEIPYTCRVTYNGFRKKSVQWIGQMYQHKNEVNFDGNTDLLLVGQRERGFCILNYNYSIHIEI